MIYILHHTIIDESTENITFKDSSFFPSEESAYSEMERQYNNSKQKKDPNVFTTILNGHKACIYGNDSSEYWDITQDPNFIPVSACFAGMQYTVSGEIVPAGKQEQVKIPEVTFLDKEQAKVYLRTIYAAALNSYGLTDNFASDENGKFVPGGFLASDSEYACMYGNIAGKPFANIVATFKIQEADMLKAIPGDEKNPATTEKSAEKTLYYFCGCINGENDNLEILTPVPFTELNAAKGYLVKRYKKVLAKMNLTENAMLDKNGDTVPGGSLSKDHTHAEIWNKNTSNAPGEMSCVASFFIRKDVVTVPVSALGKNGYPEKVSAITVVRRHADYGDINNMDVFTFMSNDEANKYAKETCRQLCREYRVPYTKTDATIGYGWFEDSCRVVNHRSCGGVVKKAPFAFGNSVELASVQMEEVNVIVNSMPKGSTEDAVINEVTRLIAECQKNKNDIDKNAKDFEKKMSYAKGAEDAYRQVIAILKSI